MDGVDELELPVEPELVLAALLLLPLLVELDDELLPQAARIEATPAAPAAPITERKRVRRLSGVRRSLSAGAAFGSRLRLTSRELFPIFSSKAQRFKGQAVMNAISPFTG